MPRRIPQSPLSPPELLDLYFLDARHKLIEIAAFLDRIERAQRSHRGKSAAEKDDYRLAALKKALKAVAENKADRAIKVQMIFSDPTTKPLESAAGMKGASGAWKGEQGSKSRSRSRSRSRSKREGKKGG